MLIFMYYFLQFTSDLLQNYMYMCNGLNCLTIKCEFFYLIEEASRMCILYLNHVLKELVAMGMDIFNGSIERDTGSLVPYPSECLLELWLLVMHLKDKMALEARVKVCISIHPIYHVPTVYFIGTESLFNSAYVRISVMYLKPYHL